MYRTQIIAILWTLSWAMFLGCSDDSSSSDQLSCGEGTVERDGQCVIPTQDLSPSQDAQDIEENTEDAEHTDFSEEQDAEDLAGEECVEGSRRCIANSDLQECQNDQWVVIQSCPEECYDNSCDHEPLASGACDQGNGPIPIELDGEAVDGQVPSFSTENFSWSGICQADYQSATGGIYEPTGPQALFSFEVPDSRYVRITVDPATSTPYYLSAHLMAACEDVSSYIRGACWANLAPGDAFEIEQLLAPGTYDLIVDSFTDYPVNFSVKVESIQAPLCGGPDQSDTPLQIVQFDSGGLFQTSGDTALGNAGDYWASSPQACGQVQDTRGKEIIYAFALHEQKKVTIQLTPTSNPSEPLGLNLRVICGDRYPVSNRVADEYSPGGLEKICALSDGSSPVTLQDILNPGEYFVYVDEIDETVSHTYTIEIALSNP